MRNIQVVEVPHIDNERVVSAVLSAEGGYIGSMLSNSCGWVYNSKRQDYTRLQTGDPIVGMAFRQRGQVHRTTEVAYVSGENCSAVQRLDLDLGIHYRPLFMARAQCVAYSSDGRFLAAGSTDGKVRLYEMQDGPDGDPIERGFFRVSKHGLTSLAFSGDGILYATLVGGEAICLDLNTKQPKPQPAVRGSRDWDKEHFCLDVGYEFPLLAFAGLGNIVTVYNRRSHLVHQLETELGGYVRSLQFLPGKRLGVVGAAGLEVWNTDTYRRELQQLHQPGQEFFCIRQYGDSLYVACSGCRQMLGVV